MVWGLGIVLVLVLGGSVYLFNHLVQKRQMTVNGWSDIEVQLKRRADLIPAIVDTVKAYAKHEKDLFADITERRAAALAAGENPRARGAAEGALATPVQKLVAIVEDYPDLKANQNFLDLQNELSSTENKLEMARRFYNGAVREYNILTKSFPSNLIAGMFGFKDKDFFEYSRAQSGAPEIDFKS